jgi:SAM-dependent methyltransferase
MPYPSDTPKQKHDLVSPRLPPDGSSGTSLQDEMGFRNTAALFQALEQQPIPAPDLKTVAAVYSYANAPTDYPLSRSLVVIGVADQSLAVVRKLVGDADDVPACLHTCTLAVKRADDNFLHALREQDVTNSKSFASFVKRLQQEGVVAILGRDKYQRFGILQPMEDDWDAAGLEYAAKCHVGNVEAVKEFLTMGISQQASVSAPAPAEASEELWQPPGADEGIAGTGFSWQPPSNDGDETEEAAFDFGNGAATASAAWEPGTPPPEDDDDDNDFNDKKRKRDGDGNGGPEFHTNAGAAAADAFYSKLNRTLDTRAASRIFHMRSFNGWIKATQIQELNPKTKLPGSKKLGGPIRVLDLACGKGGDLGKWILHPRTIGNYVGLDVARGSLRDAALRVRSMRQKLKLCTFTVADLGSDVPGRLKSPRRTQMQKLLSWSLQDEPDHETNAPEFKMVRGGGVSQQDKFDVVSVQFAIHYMMQTRTRARRFFNTVSELLEIGGELIATTIDARVVMDHLMAMGLDLHYDEHRTTAKPGATIKVGAGACQIRFTPEIIEKIFTANSADLENMFGLEYSFTLVEGSDHAAGVGDAVNLPEWLTPIPMLESLAIEVGLELVYAQNFHEFYGARADPSSNPASHSSLYNMRVLNRNGSISPEEWEISRLYCAIKFRKVRESSITLDESDEEEEEEDAVEEEPAEIDPLLKAKLMPMAMMKAKRAAGDDVWKSLASDEKTRLTGIELQKLASAAS